MWTIRVPNWALSIIMLAALVVSGCAAKPAENKAVVKVVEEKLAFEQQKGALTIADSSCTTPGLPGECTAIAVADNYAIKGVVCGYDLKCHVAPGVCQVDGESVYDCSGMYDYLCGNDQNAKDFVAVSMGGNPCVEPKCAFVLPDPTDPTKTNKKMGLVNLPPRKKGAPGYPAPYEEGKGTCKCTQEQCGPAGENWAGKTCTPLATSAEVCGDNVDNNCNDLTDEEGSSGCTQYYVDSDSDTYGAGSGKCLCASGQGYTATVKGDCDDTDKSINPKAVESCNSKDDNCDGMTDPVDAAGCLNFYLDADADGYGDQALKCLCGPSGQYSTSLNGDCNDSDKLISPAAKESCNSKDDNCDGATDEVDAAGCAIYYTDADGDTYGVSPSACMCGPSQQMTTLTAGDCADTDKFVNPKSTEACDGKDNDCDGSVDEEGAVNCTNFYLDADGDGYGTGTPKCLCASSGNYAATQGGDCDDADSMKKPGLVEACDGKDNDCDGSVDEDNVCLCQDAVQVDILDQYNSSANAYVVDINTTNAGSQSKLVSNWLCADGSSFMNSIGAEFAVRPMASTSYLIYVQFVPNKTYTPTGSFTMTLQSVASCGPNVDGNGDGVNETVDQNICLASSPVAMVLNGTGKYDTQLTLDGRKTTSGLNPNGVLVGKLRIWKVLK